MKNDKANKREVVTGLDDGIYVEVLNGLVGDENIIISGHNGISDGEVVKISRKSKGE